MARKKLSELLDRFPPNIHRSRAIDYQCNVQPAFGHWSNDGPDESKLSE
jgi:hypothetical protein